MSFPSVSALQPRTCHLEDHQFTQHLTLTEGEGQKKGSGKEVRGKKRDEEREGDERGKEGT